MSDLPNGANAARRCKTDIRINVLARRRSLPATIRSTAAGRVQAGLADLVRQHRPRTVTAYVPVGAEPGGPDLPEFLLAALAATGVSRPRLLLPVLCPDLDLDWAEYAGSEPLVAAGRGLREPAGPRLGPAAVGAADLVVVPAVAVDRRGFRLGRGGGSYDRALARVAPATLTVALLHDGELLDLVPAEEHDRPVRVVITPGDGVRALPAG
ncbi:5-formyltetrahydrofolate cyclo-ligase [Polymorphospora rubra]|uniref:5-formyltetrahydrofolate cyclo-ligase n=1 Tax=Polymorphospora rubra TaxID=338584 RepID=A0A810MYA9_9ACTN|nr:5-formyltetrahydrofolate cyclo-ligase [Polymorphospora rubra]BCJ66241.1 5-formyltetrahydrofolate cyclo-ligase [Polymorphospora rubra]